MTLAQRGISTYEDCIRGLMAKEDKCHKMSLKYAKGSLVWNVYNDREEAIRNVFLALVESNKDFEDEEKAIQFTVNTVDIWISDCQLRAVPAPGIIRGYKLALETLREGHHHDE